MTAAIVAKGARIFQVHKLGTNDREHVARLLKLFDPLLGAHIIDAGCGVGAVAALMLELRPDLRFTLVNISAAQLDMCSPIGELVQADFHRLPLMDRSADAIMFCYSLGHALLEDAFQEAARVLRLGGVLFIYDLAADCPDRLINGLGYVPHAPLAVCREGARQGFDLRMIAEPHDASINDFIALFGREEYDRAFTGARPVIYRFVRDGSC